MLATGVLTGGGLAPSVAAAADGGAGGTGGDGGTVITAAEIIGLGDYIRFSDKKDDGAIGGLIKATTADGGVLFVYCLDSGAAVVPGSAYHEAGRSDVPTLKGNPDAGKVSWILQHGYPAVTEGELGELVGGKLSKERAAGATQAAIWRITNHVTGVPFDSVGAKVADYLAAHAVDEPEPGASLSLAPGAVTGEAGSVLGPIGITSTGEPVGASLDPAAAAAGVVLTDGEGKVLSDGSGKLTRPTKNGDALFVKAPAGSPAGSATVTATASVPASAGRAMVSRDSQALLLASADASLATTATAKASWTAGGASPSPTATPTGTASPTAQPSPSTSPTATGGPTATGEPTTPGGSASPSGSANPNPNPNPDPNPKPTATPGDTSSPSAVPNPGAEPSGGTGGALAATGAGGGVRIAAGAGAGLLLAGGVLVLLHERRRRRRSGA
ncbi:Cys-Gln thioester bond-forming surface protein [Kitasatospora sp. NPDC127059]|uniref:thioester domain-containing protein n=1 Tax=unclassified Kitasatospora TaxID=2633591 RepID=UPI00365B4390